MDVQTVPPGAGQLPGMERPVSTRVRRRVGLPVQMARRLVSLAIRAPSVHNTQPWAWRIGPDGIEPVRRRVAPARRRRPHGTQPRDQLWGGPASSPGRGPCVRTAPRGSPSAGCRRIPPCWRASGSPPRGTYHDSGRPARHRGALHRPSSLHLVAGTERAVERSGAHRRRRRRPWPCRSPTSTDRFRVDLMVARSHRLQERDVAIAEEVDAGRTTPPTTGCPSDHLSRRPHVVADKLPSRFDEGLLPDDGPGGGERRRPDRAVRRRRLPGVLAPSR